MNEQTPHNTADMLGITPVTLRRWCDYHKEYLSAGVNPPAGQARRFTGKDIEVLKHVKQLRAQGLTVARINEQLATLTFAEIETEANTGADSIESPADTRQGQGTAIVPKVDAEFITSIERRVGLLERSAQEGRPQWWWFVAGIAAGLVWLRSLNCSHWWRGVNVVG